MAWLMPAPAVRSADAQPVSLAAIEPIVAHRCAPCHAAHPTLMASAPAGVMLDTPGRIIANAPRIFQQAVQLRAMPLGNVTNITDTERALLGAWYAGRQ
jgi:uncharacterized membrane protein